MDNTIIPQSAQFYKLNPSKKFIEKYYKYINIKFNDGTNKDILHYWGEQGGWHPSASAQKDPNFLTKLTKIN